VKGPNFIFTPSLRDENKTEGRLVEMSSTSNTIFAVNAYVLTGTIDLALVYYLTVCSIVGALIGPDFSS